jgi:type I restriction enzyme, S subunit
VLRPPLCSLGDLLTLERRPVDVAPSALYQEIGVYCFGKGIFHKTPRTGLEVGDKALVRISKGDFILQLTFAWEGAVAIASDADDGLYGSTRFLTFRVNEARCHAPYLLNYFNTPGGREQLVRISPGSAGRNRVLSIKRLPEVAVPLPPLEEQRRIVARIEELASKFQLAGDLRASTTSDTSHLIPGFIAQMVDGAGWQHQPLREVLRQPPRNGLAPKPEVPSGGMPMLRINAVSSSPTRHVDLTAVKHVQVSDAEAEPFLLQDGDVFIVRYNGDINRVAKAAIYRAMPGVRAVFPDKLIRLRTTSDALDPDYLVVALTAASVRAQIERLGKTTAGNIGVSGANAKSLVIPVPPLTEQRRIVADLDAFQTRVVALRDIQSRGAAELDALLPSILDKAFKGEL